MRVAVGLATLLVASVEVRCEEIPWCEGGSAFLCMYTKNQRQSSKTSKGGTRNKESKKHARERARLSVRARFPTPNTTKWYYEMCYSTNKYKYHKKHMSALVPTLCYMSSYYHELRRWHLIITELL